MLQGFLADFTPTGRESQPLGASGKLDRIAVSLLANFTPGNKESEYPGAEAQSSNLCRTFPPYELPLLH